MQHWTSIGRPCLLDGHPHRCVYSRTLIICNQQGPVHVRKTHDVRPTALARRSLMMGGVAVITSCPGAQADEVLPKLMYIVWLSASYKYFS
jgi:hypothetical protein